MPISATASAPAPTATQHPFHARHPQEGNNNAIIESQTFGPVAPHSHRSSAVSLKGYAPATSDGIHHSDDHLDASWFSTSPHALRGSLGGGSGVPQTPNNMRKLTNDTPGLSSSASNTPAGVGHDMPWTPVQPNFTRPISGLTMHGPLMNSNTANENNNKGLHMLNLGFVPNHMQPEGPHAIPAGLSSAGSVGMARIASAPLPYHPNLFNTPTHMNIDLPPHNGPMFTPDVFMMQSQDSYFTAPATTAMSRSMTDIQQQQQQQHGSSHSISPMVIMERSLSSSSSMPSLTASDGGLEQQQQQQQQRINATPATPASSTGKTPRRRQRRIRDPPEVSSEQHKPHECHQCKNRFIRLEHLKRHWRTHSKERPHQCPYPGCTKAFGRTDNRDQHVKTHYKGQQMKQGITQLMALTNGEDGSRNDPHNAARSSAVAALEAASRSRRVTGLEGPIALVQPGSGSPSRSTLSRGGLISSGSNNNSNKGRPTNDENNMPPSSSSPASPYKGMAMFRQDSIGSISSSSSGHSDSPASPPLQLKTAADFNIVRLGVGPNSGNGPLEAVPLPNQNPFVSSYQHHFGDTSGPGGPMATTTPLSASASASASASSCSSSSSLSSGGASFMQGQPLLYTISENELQFVAASGAVAPYPLTPSLAASGPNGTGCEPPFLYSPSALGLTNVNRPAAGQQQQQQQQVMGLSPSMQHQQQQQQLRNQHTSNFVSSAAFTA